MLAYARLRPGPGFQPGRAGLYYAQRMATWPGARGSISRAIAAAVRLRRGTGSWAAVAPRHSAVAAALRQDGIAMLADLVSPEQAAAMLSYFRAQSLVAADGRTTTLDDLPPGTGMATYPLRTVLESTDVLDVVNAAPVLRLASDYLGCKPTLSSLGVRWSFPGGRAAGTQVFHRDPDDWRFLKLFVYLTDVDAGSGPHTYVTGSHGTAAQIRMQPYDRPAIESRYGRDSIRTITGPRGTAFMADTWGIHAGPVPTSVPRLLLQAQYSILPVYSFRYEPLALRKPPAVDRYVNRLLIAS